MKGSRIIGSRNGQLKPKSGSDYMNLRAVNHEAREVAMEATWECV